MSAAVVSGVVAVLKQQRPNLLTPNLAKAVLQFTAIPMKDDGGAVYGALRQGTGEIKLESTDRASGYYTIRADNDPGTSVRTSGVYLRADPGDWAVLDSGSGEERRALIAERLRGACRELPDPTAADPGCLTEPAPSRCRLALFVAAVFPVEWQPCLSCAIGGHGCWHLGPSPQASPASI